MAGGTAAELAKGSSLNGVEWLAVAPAGRTNPKPCCVRRKTPLI